MEKLEHDHVPLDSKAILYLCDFTCDPLNIEIRNALSYPTISGGFDAYANIANPESQLVYGETRDELLTKLDTLHINMDDPKWLEGLAEAL
jgi:hypothetical protein